MPPGVGFVGIRLLLVIILLGFLVKSSASYQTFQTYEIIIDEQ